jgi:hypothetical protein
LTAQILKDGTEFFSRGTPNLATVIPAMDHIDMTFTNAIKPDSKAHPAIRYALHLAKKTLNKYYSLTDEAEVYHIAMGKHLKLIINAPSDSFVISVLHPQHKLAYFWQAGWTSDWIDTAESLVRDVFEVSYTMVNSNSEDENKDDEKSDSDEAESTVKQEKVCSNMFHICFFF